MLVDNSDFDFSGHCDKVENNQVYNKTNSPRPLRNSATINFVRSIPWQQYFHSFPDYEVDDTPLKRQLLFEDMFFGGRRCEFDAKSTSICKQVSKSGCTWLCLYKNCEANRNLFKFRVRIDFKNLYKIWYAARSKKDRTYKECDVLLTSDCYESFLEKYWFLLFFYFLIL